MSARFGRSINNTNAINAALTQACAELHDLRTENMRLRHQATETAAIHDRCVTESPRFPGPWRAALAKALPDEHGDAIRRFQTAHPNATAADIAGRVLGVPGLGNTTIPPAPDWHADPHCEHCDGSGIARLDDIGQGTYGPCECRRTEPYPDADVIEMRWA